MHDLPANAKEQDDAAVVRAVQAGDCQAFERLLDRHLTHLRTFLALKAPVAHLVDELAHEAFVYAFRNLHKFQVGTDFRAWLRAIAWNLLRAETQRFSREQANLSRLAAHSHSDPQAGAEAHGSAEIEALEDCVQRVPPAMRELLALKYRDERSTEEIARKLERNLAWVRTVLFRLRQQLKQCIEGKMPS